MIDPETGAGVERLSGAGKIQIALARYVAGQTAAIVQAGRVEVPTRRTAVPGPERGQCDWHKTGRRRR